MPGDPAPIQILVRNASTGKDNTAMQDNTVEQNNSSLILPGWTRELPEVSANGEAIDIRKYGVRFGDDDLESVLFFPMRLLQNLFEEEVLSREIELLLNNPKDKDDLVR